MIDQGRGRRGGVILLVQNERNSSKKQISEIQV